ncbi:MAG TPA: hypothetical protein VLD65_12065 [Anaerolineales bacterium]|nr:hypothetical protein [Anaerolineales bacterium]
MTDYFATTVGARGRQRMNGTLEAIKRMHYTLPDHVERFIVVVSADFTTRHKIISFFNV